MKKFTEKSLRNCVSSLFFEDTTIVQETVLMNSLQSIQFLHMQQSTFLQFCQLPFTLILPRTTLDKT
jgi:hypothetical protein